MRTLIAFLLLASTVLAQSPSAESSLSLFKFKQQMQHVSTPIAEQSVPIPADGQLSPQEQWRWSQSAWAWQPVVNEPAYRTVTIPARGQWERVCMGRGCTNRWVEDAPARTIRVEGTALRETSDLRPRASGNYPSRSVSGRRWTQNGHVPTAQHLAGGHHSHEHFSLPWLRTLSSQQRTALASDAHEGRVRDAFVVRD